MKDFNKSSYSAGELVSLTKSITSIYENFDNINDLFIHEIVPVLKKQNLELSSLLIKSKNEEVNKALTETDQKRDDAFIAFRDYCKIFESYFIPYKANSARKICNMIKDLGYDIEKKRFFEESITVNILIRKLETPELIEHIKVIGAETLFNDLKKAQANFEKLYSKEISSSDYSNYPSILEKKTEIDELIYTLGSYTEFKARFHKDLYEELHSKVVSLFKESSHSAVKI